MVKLLLITGPSGSGKDTLLRSLKQHLTESNKPDSTLFVRRYITRQPDSNEDNFFIEASAFHLLKKAGYFSSTWQAHENFYGIPAHIFYNIKTETKVLICSISRSAIGDFEKMDHLETTTLLITAKREVLKKRLLNRGREAERMIETRLDRALLPVEAKKLTVFDNSGDLSRTRLEFIELFEELTSNRVKLTA